MKIFVAGPRALKALDKNVENKLTNIINKNITVLVGDANGIDKSFQQYFYDINYKNVIIYASKGNARNNIGNWLVENIEVSNNVKGFDFYAAKDLKMAENADYGFMLWNGKSKGTLNNIINLTKLNKQVLIYFTPHQKFYMINNLEIAKKFASACSEETINLFNFLSNKTNKINSTIDFDQLTLFDNTN